MRKFLVLIIIVIMLICISCSATNNNTTAEVEENNTSETVTNETNETNDDYKDTDEDNKSQDNWLTYESANFTFIYPKTLKNIFPDFGIATENNYSQIKEMLVLKAPNKIIYYVYYNQAQLRRFAARDKAYVNHRKSTIHALYNEPSPKVLTLLLVYFIDKNAIQTPLVMNGITEYIYYSLKPEVKDIYIETLKNIILKTYVPLLDMWYFGAEDILYAGFMKFLLDNYGMDNFKKYYSNQTINGIKSVLAKDINQLEEEWQTFLKKYAEEKGTVVSFNYSKKYNDKELIERANVFVYYKEWELAKEMTTQLLEIYPSSYNTYYIAGKVLVFEAKIEEMDKAIEYLRKIFEFDNVDKRIKGWSYCYLGDAYFIKGDKSTAILLYKKSIELNASPDSVSYAKKRLRELNS